MDLRVKPVKELRGEICVPGDKSISHRSVMLGALSQGITEVEGFLPGADCLSTIRCFQEMGIEIEGAGTPYLRIHGRGLRGLQEPGQVLDVGNSGTSIRLIMGILAGQPFFSALTGDASIRRRPMGRVTNPLAQMGAKIWGRQQGTLAPLAIQGGELKGIDYESPVASAQVKSAVLLAGLFAAGETSVTEPEKSRDHTERMLRAFGAPVVETGNKVSIGGFPRLEGQKVRVPGDISSAAFFLVAGAIVPKGEILIKNVGINPTRDGIIAVLQRMGADLQVLNPRLEAGEPVADLLIRSSGLQGTVIEGKEIPRLIDEIPILAVAAAMASGETIIRDAAELKVKETNRIATVVQELRRFGVDVEEREDGMRILGGNHLRGALCQSHGDHRIAMAMAVAGLVATGETIVSESECVDVSFPGFEKILAELSCR